MGFFFSSSPSTYCFTQKRIGVLIATFFVSPAPSAWRIAYSSAAARSNASPVSA